MSGYGNEVNWSESILKNNLFILGKVAKFTPDYFVWMVVEGLVWGMINSASAIFSFNLLNAVSNGSDFAYALKIIAIMATFYLLAYAFDKWYWLIRNPLMRQKLHLKMHAELFSKAQTLDLACFDDPEFYNDFVWAMNESDKRAIDVMEDTGKLINRIVASSSLFGLLLTVDPIIALMLFVGIPLPGTGAWTGTLAASLLDLDFKKSVLAVMAGVIIAGVIMLVISLFGLEFLSWLL